ncbi:MAG: hypothetical protein DI629_14975 [Mesorhizobium amorphae]|nr:MAG: hypothetical protein DI629_14975 [Mesorhizobium amorphae]
MGNFGVRFAAAGNQPPEGGCFGVLANGGPTREIAERADTALAESGQQFQDRYVLEVAFAEFVRGALDGASTGNWADDIMLREEIQSTLQHTSYVEFAACLPGYATAMAQIEAFEAGQAAEQQARAANEQSEAKKQAREAHLPQNVLAGAYSNYIMVRNCHESREGYAIVYVSDQEMERSRDAVQKIEAAIKAANPDLDTDRIWAEAANPKPDAKSEFLGQLFALSVIAEGNEDQVCKMAMGQLRSILENVAPEATVIEKDF